MKRKQKYNMKPIIDLMDESINKLKNNIMAFPVTKEGEGGVHVPYPTEIKEDDSLALFLIKGTKKDQKLVDEWNQKHSK